jgi:hypothetical protein
LLTFIRTDIDGGKFDPKNYINKEIRSLDFDNYVTSWVTRREQAAARGHISKAYLKEIRSYTRRYYIPFLRRSRSEISGKAILRISATGCRSTCA